MHSILAACLTTAGAARAHAIGQAIAARSGATIRWTTPETAAGELPYEPGGDGVPDLVLVSPRAPEESTWLGYDRATSALLRRVESGVLVIRGPVDWPPRRVVLPVGRPEIEGGVLAEAASWIERLCTPSTAGAPPVEAVVLHLAVNPEELHADTPVLRDQIARARETAGASLDLQIEHCTRWGAHPWKRILIRAAEDRPRLTILNRGAPGARPGPVQAAWFHISGRSDSAVLLLPRVPGAAPPPPAAEQPPTDIPRPVRDEWLPPLPA